MALFEFDSGRLIPAQFGKPVSQGLQSDVLESIRAQVLEVIDRPLFPVAWMTQDGADPDGGPHSLSALDASGQVVSVEVLNRLDPISMVGALSRLGEISNLGWMDLASRYPGGIEPFQAGWAEFREAMPPNSQPGPRLILVVAEIDPSIFSALGVLYASGMEIHQISSREMSDGRRFLEVMQVSQAQIIQQRPQIGGHQAPRPQLSWQAERSSSGVIPALDRNGEEGQPAPAGKDSSTIPQARPESPVDPVDPVDPEETLIPKAAPPAPAQPAAAPAVPAATPAGPAEKAEKPGPNTLELDQEALVAISSVIGQPAVLLWSDDRGRIVEALLTDQGQIDPGNGQLTTDVQQAFTQAGGDSQAIDGWQAFHIGTVTGPTLSEAVEELNREIERDYYRNN